jgi:hypothetical protein
LYRVRQERSPLPRMRSSWIAVVVAMQTSWLPLLSSYVYPEDQH